MRATKSAAKAAKATKATKAAKATTATKASAATAASATTSAKPARAATAASAATSAKTSSTKTTSSAKTSSTKPSSKKPSSSSSRSTEPTVDTTALVAAVASGDGDDALDAALALWHATHAPAVADAIDAISERISPPPPANESEFTELAAMENPAVLGSLIAAVPELAASFLPTAAELLEPYATDPRLAIAIATWAQDPPTSSTSTYPFWTRSLGYLAASQDTRAIALLERRIAKAPDAKSQFWPKFYRALTKTIDALASTTPGTIKVPKLALAKLVRSAATKPAKKPAAPKPAKATGPGLAGVASQIGNGDIAGAIDAMLDRWRATRVPELARLIERATTLLPAYDRPLGETDKAATAAWTAAYDEDPVANLPALLANLTTGGAREAESRLTMLGRVPDDPRISFHLATVCGTRDIGPQRTQFWRSTFELLARIADQRVAEMLRYSFDNFEGTYYDHHKQARRLIKPYVTAALEAPVPVFDRDDTKHAAAISAALDTAIAHDPARTILAAIAESPEDPGPVLVYADWLALRGHPRGEYLVLACKSPLDPSEIKRHAALRNVPCLFGPFGATGYKPHDTVHGLVRTAHVSYFTNGYLMRALADFPLMALVQALVSESMHTTVEDYAALVDASPKLASITLVSSTKITASTLAARLGSSWVAEGATVRRI